MKHAFGRMIVALAVVALLNSAAVAGDQQDTFDATGKVSDPAYAGSGDGTIVGLLKALVSGVGVTSLPPGTASRTDRSGTVTLGGTAQTLMPANAVRRGCEGQNQSNGDLWVNDAGGTATATQPNIWLPPGAYYQCPPTGVSPSAFSMLGGTTGQPFMWREW